MKTTALYRNFIRTPQIIAIAFRLVSFLGLCFVFSGFSLWVYFPMALASYFACEGMSDSLKGVMVSYRFHHWMFTKRDISLNGVDKFLQETSPEKLEAMVALDLEGKVVDQEEEDFLDKCECDHGCCDKEVK